MARIAGVDASEWSWCPIFVDVDLDGFEDLLITTGHEMEMMNMDAIMEVGRRHGLPVIEDCSQAHLTTYRGRLCGTIGEIAAFARIKYRGYAHWSGAEGPGWSHDYPNADEHLVKILKEVTTLHPYLPKKGLAGGVIVALDDPGILEQPHCAVDG